MSDQDYMAALGPKIQAKRNALGLTQAEVAEVLNVSLSAVSNWEAGSAVIGAPMLARLEAYFRQCAKAQGKTVQVLA